MAASSNVPRSSLIAAALVYLVDAFVMNQGAIAMIAVLAGLVGLVIGLGKGLLRKEWPPVARGLVRAAAFLVAAAGVFATNHWQNQQARGRAEVVIAACEAYRLESGRYPERLDQLVPRFLPSVPRAKYVLAFGQFTYVAGKDHHVLMLTVVPPFGRSTYDLERGRWGAMD